MKVHVIQMTMRNENHTQRGKFVEGQSGGTVSFKNVKPAEIEGVREKIFPVQMNKYSRMAYEDCSVLPWAKGKGGSRKGRNPRSLLNTVRI